MHDHGERDDDSVEYERSTFEHGAEDWKDPQVLEKLYHDEGLSQSDVADELGTTQQNISNWMDKFDIETEPPMHERDRSVLRCIREDGRVQYKIPDPEEGYLTLYENQATAINEYTIEAVFSEESEVDHLLHSPLKLNFVENLRPRTATSHRKRHSKSKTALPHTKLLSLLYGDGSDDRSEFFQRVDQIFDWQRDIEGAEEAEKDDATVGVGAD